MDFQIESPGLEGPLVRLYEILLDHGAYFAPDLYVKESGGAFSVCCLSHGETGSEAIRLPVDCLVPMTGFSLGCDNDRFTILKVSDSLAKHQKESLELMVQIYNAADKLADYKRHAIWFSYNNIPAIRNHLLHGRGRTSENSWAIRLLENGQLDELAVRGYLKSRELTLNIENQPTRCLMPFIEYCNHHYFSPGFQGIHGDGGVIKGVMIAKGAQIQGSPEVFVKYNLCDTLDFLVEYEYLDEAVPWLRSIPLQIDLQDLQLLIGAVVIGEQNDVPQELAGLGAYFPIEEARDRRSMRLSHILIPPPEALLSMRRILAFHLGSFSGSASHNELRLMVLAAEKAILDHNVDYYKALQNELLSPKEILTPSQHQTLSRLVAVQLGKLDRYQNLISNLWTQELQS